MLLQPRCWSSQAELKAVPAGAFGIRPMTRASWQSVDKDEWLWHGELALLGPRWDREGLVERPPSST